MDDYLFHRLGQRRRLMLDEMGIKVYPPNDWNLQPISEKENHHQTEQELAKDNGESIISVSPQTPKNTPKPLNPEQEKGHFGPRLVQASEAIPENAQPIVKMPDWEISALRPLLFNKNTENANIQNWLLIIDAPFVDNSPLAKMLENCAHALRLSARTLGVPEPVLWVVHVGRTGERVGLDALAENQEKSSMCALNTGLLAHAQNVPFVCAIVAGRVPVQAVLGLEGAPGALRGGDYVLDFQKWVDDLGILKENIPRKIPALLTYEIPYLLRAPVAKSAFWDDLCRAFDI